MKTLPVIIGLLFTLASVSVAGGPYVNPQNPFLGSVVLGIGILAGGILVLITAMLSRPSKEDMRSIIKEELVLIRAEIQREREERNAQIHDMSNYIKDVENRSERRQQEIMERLR